MTLNVAGKKITPKLLADALHSLPVDKRKATGRARQYLFRHRRRYTRPFTVKAHGSRPFIQDLVTSRMRPLSADRRAEPERLYLDKESPQDNGGAV